jgi:hypothetical protein
MTGDKVETYPQDKKTVVNYSLPTANNLLQYWMTLKPGIDNISYILKTSVDLGVSEPISVI